MGLNFNTNLLSLKCVLFLFFGGIGCLFPFLPLHMNAVGLSKDESTLVSVIAPLVATLGPLVAAPLADRLAGGFGGASRSKTGRYLRVMIAICLILSVILYWMLMLIPLIERSPPAVTFVCNEEGGYILQDRCGSDKICYNWNDNKGTILVKRCKFACNVTTTWTNEPLPEVIEEHTPSPFDSDYPYEDSDDIGPGPEAEILPDVETNINTGISLHPHMCYLNKEIKNNEICEVYTKYSKPISFTIGLKPTVTKTENNEDYCKYPFVDAFHCQIPHDLKSNASNENAACINPVVACELHWPYNNTDSLLKVSQCGYNNISLYLYILIRCLADIFPAAAVTLLATVIVIATRETSTGRGDIGKQLLAGALGLAIFPPIIGAVGEGKYLAAILSFTVLFLLAALILIFDKNMPLSPPEWWWHTRCGLLALPMSSVRKYGIEIVALGAVLFILGIFWNAIDAFLPWHVVKLHGGSALIIGLTYTIAALPAVIYLYFAERIVDYLGHSNVLILCFVSYIIHYLALTLIKTAGLLLVCEILEIFTLHLMWVTAILYLRHLVPRKFTACGQALPIIAHFCLGRCIGAWIGSTAYTEYPHNFRTTHKWFTVAASIIAIIYFLLYHFYLKVYCAAPSQLPPDPAPSVAQGMNGNGAFTPLRVYHNSSSKKGHFRY